MIGSTALPIERSRLLRITWPISRVLDAVFASADDNAAGFLEDVLWERATFAHGRGGWHAVPDPI